MIAQSLARRTVVVDSNLLLLLVVGLWNPRAIAVHKRLSAHTYADFLELSRFLSSFHTVVTTAHVLAEVSNLAGFATGATREAILLQLASVIKTLDERAIPATVVSSQPEFKVFGITDAALSLLCADMLLLTEDGRLARHLQLRGFSAWTLDQVKMLKNRENSH